jgi:hypothetical protein
VGQGTRQEVCLSLQGRASKARVRYATQECPAAVRYSDRLCGLEVRAPDFITEMYCASCEVRTEFINVT